MISLLNSLFLFVVCREEGEGVLAAVMSGPVRGLPFGRNRRNLGCPIGAAADGGTQQCEAGHDENGLGVESHEHGHEKE